MKAVVTNPYVMGYLELGEAVNPVANSDEAMISIKTFSRNRNEFRREKTVPASARILVLLQNRSLTLRRD